MNKEAKKNYIALAEVSNNIDQNGKPIVIAVRRININELEGKPSDQRFVPVTSSNSPSK